MDASDSSEAAPLSEAIGRGFRSSASGMLLLRRWRAVVLFWISDICMARAACEASDRFLAICTECSRWRVAVLFYICNICEEERPGIQEELLATDC